MALEHKDVVDVIGIERDSGFAVLTIADAWDWNDPHVHLKALQDKLNHYLMFVESGQIFESYTDAVGKPIVIDIIGKYPVPENELAFFDKAAAVARELKIEIRVKYFSSPPNDAQ